MNIERISSLKNRVINIIEAGRNKIYRTIDTTVVETYWNIGKEIVEEEQGGEIRAEYGKEIISELSKELTQKYGKGYGERNLRRMRQIYTVYPIWTTVLTELSWSQLLLIANISQENKRSFFEIETIKNNWSVRELERQINSLLYERLALSKNKEKVLELANEGHIIKKAEDIVKDPYILEFTGLPEREYFNERDLETKLIDHLQEFLLELGKGFSFVKRQKRISFDGDHFYIDLVFYNYILKCFVLIDLKTGKLSHQDVGQMQMYVNYYKEELKTEGDNDPIGIILCTEKNNAVVKYTVAGNQNIFASKYKLYLPTEEELKEEILKEKEIIELEEKIKNVTE